MFLNHSTKSSTAHNVISEIQSPVLQFHINTTIITVIPQVQELPPMCSYDIVGSLIFLLLSYSSGSIIISVTAGAVVSVNSHYSMCAIRISY